MSTDGAETPPPARPEPVSATEAVADRRRLAVQLADHGLAVVGDPADRLASEYLRCGPWPRRRCRGSSRRVEKHALYSAVSTSWAQRSQLLASSHNPCTNTTGVFPTCWPGPPASAHPWSPCARRSRGSASQPSALQTWVSTHHGLTWRCCIGSKWDRSIGSNATSGADKRRGGVHSTLFQARRRPCQTGFAGRAALMQQCRSGSLGLTSTRCFAHLDPRILDFPPELAIFVPRANWRILGQPGSRLLTG